MPGPHLRCTPISAAMTVTAVLLAGCGPAGQEAATEPRPGGTPVVIVPDDAVVETLTFPSGDIHVTSEAPFPLMAYRQFCQAVRHEEFGLARPSLSVLIRQRGGQTETVLFGTSNFTGGGIYAAKPDSPCVFLVPAASVHGLAALAGDELAAPFMPPPRQLADVDGPLPNPWVEQAERHWATSPVNPPGRPGEPE